MTVTEVEQGVVDSKLQKQFFKVLFGLLKNNCNGVKFII
jgi:hypothetical protein